jgi:hypothetical protein
MSAKIITANGNPESPVGPDPADAHVVGAAAVKEYATINEEWCGDCIQTDGLRWGRVSSTANELRFKEKMLEMVPWTLSPG